MRCWVAEEHPDNDRFMRDCENWFGKKVTVLTADKYHGSIYEVFEKERYLVGPSGARCTRELKKALREAYEHPSDVQVFGYDIDEQARIDRFIDANPRVRMRNPLVDAKLTKADCLALVQRAGIALPAMYRLGYANNNCVGCVKGGVGYWNKVRVDFPAVFERMARMEEYLGRQINRITVDGVRTRVSLRQLPPDAGDFEGEQPSDCGPFCLMAEDSFRAEVAP